MPQVTTYSHQSIAEDPAFSIRQLMPGDLQTDHTSYPQTGYRIIWLQQGHGTHQVNQMAYPITGNCLLLVAPGQVHRLSVTDDVQGYVISFTESFLSDGNEELDGIYDCGFFHMFYQCTLIHPDAESSVELQDILQKIIRESGHHRSLRAAVISRYIKIFLIHIIRQFELSQPAITQQINNGLVKKFLAMVEKNFREQKQVTAYAAHLSVTPNHLNEMVKKMSGYPASHHIRQRIIQEAKRKASYSEANMKQIAYYLGFETSSHFSRFFKNLTGENFTDYKKSKAQHAYPF